MRIQTETIVTDDDGRILGISDRMRIRRLYPYAIVTERKRYYDAFGCPRSAPDGRHYGESA